MKLRAILLVVAVVAVGVVLPMERALACSCEPSPSEQRFVDRADVVIDGLITGREDLDPNEPQGGHLRFTVETERAIKGSITGSVAIRSVKGGSLCGVDFLEGARYRIFATRDDQNDLQTGLCSGNRRIYPAERIAGADRFETAARLSAATFSPGVPAVVVVNGDTFADALAGSALAAHLGGPILLVQRDAVPAATDAELRRLTPAGVVVLGGPAVVSDAVVSALDATGTGSVKRTYGDDRFATAAAAGEEFEPGVAVVYVASGLAFADGLAGGAAAGARDAPLLTIDPQAISESTGDQLRRLAPDSIVVLGGPAAVSAGVEEELGDYAPVTRLAGGDRFATAAAVAEAAFPTAATAVLASGIDFPDALAAGVLAAGAGGPLLLVSPGCVPSATAGQLGRVAPGRVVVAGGPAAVADTTVQGYPACY